MIATALLISNFKELKEDQERSEQLSIPAKVAPIYTEREIGFQKNAVAFAFLTDDGNIKTCLAGQEIMLKFEKKIWTKLRNHFKNN